MGRGARFAHLMHTLKDVVLSANLSKMTNPVWNAGATIQQKLSWDSEATVGVLNWGSGGSKSGVSNMRKGRVSDGLDGRILGSGDSRGHRGLNAGLRKTRTPVFWRMKRPSPRLLLSSGVPEREKR